MNGRLLTAEEVATLLSLPTTWVYAAARRGEVPSVAARALRALRRARHRRVDRHPQDDERKGDTMSTTYDVIAVTIRAAA